MPAADGIWNVFSKFGANFLVRPKPQHNSSHLYIIPFHEYSEWWYPTDDAFLLTSLSLIELKLRVTAGSGFINLFALLLSASNYSPCLSHFRINTIQSTRRLISLSQQNVMRFALFPPAPKKGVARAITHMSTKILAKRGRETFT